MREKKYIMEYDSVFRKIGGFGKYQKTFLFVVSLASTFNAMTTFNSQNNDVLS
jgi:hypothetical protein